MTSHVSRVGFILKPDSADARALLEDLVPWLGGQGLAAVVTTEDQVATPGAEIVPEDQLAAACDLCVVLGGDGTMLRAARLVADAGRAVLGVNLGQLGFLAGFTPAEARDALGAAVRGELAVSERMRLAVTFRRAGGDQPRVIDPMFPGAAPGDIVLTALNDAVIHQGAMARLVEIIVHIDRELVADYRADGLIVASPTGSTAYNMAAGGPILIPGQAAMTLTPICAHSLTNRPLVVPSRATIRLELGGESRGVVITVDGQWAHSFGPGDVAEVTSAARPLRLLAANKSYFDIMREKLNWGVRGDKGAR